MRRNGQNMCRALRSMRACSTLPEPVNLNQLHLQQDVARGPGSSIQKELLALTGELGVDSLAKHFSIIDL